MAHSPLPWFSGEDVPEPGEEGGDFNGSILSIDPAEPEYGPYEVARYVDKVDADLIIRAVNSHADLVAALEDGIRILENLLMARFRSKYLKDDAERLLAEQPTLQKMRAALAKKGT